MIYHYTSMKVAKKQQHPQILHGEDADTLLMGMEHGTSSPQNGLAVCLVM